MGFFSGILDKKASKNSATVLGVDVGSSSIKVVELEDRNGIVTLKTYGEVQLGPYVGKPLGSVVHLDARQEQEALVDVIRESAVTSNNGVFAMPLASSFISTSTLPAGDNVDISSLVRVEARKLIPASLSEVTLDWAELDHAGSDTDVLTVLIAAIQNTAIERFNVLMQFVGFTGAPTEIECFSANRTISKKDYNVILDFGATSSKMYISHKGIIVRMHRINVGGADVTHQLANTLSVDFATAEEIKIQIHKTSDQYAAVHQAYQQTFNRAFREFTLVLERYQAERGLEQIRINVCGGASLLPGFTSQLEAVFNSPVELADPFATVAYPAFMEDAMKQIGPLFVPALGAALRNFE